MRKWAAAVPLVCLALVVGCGGDDESSSDESSASGGGGKNYSMTLIAGVKGDEFYITMN